MWRFTGLVALGLVVISCGSKESKSSPPEPTPEEDAGTTTPPESNVVRFIAVGDTGTGMNNQYKVANGIEDFCKKRGCDFIQFLGDNIYESGAESADDPIFEEVFEAPYKAIDLDFWIVLGNHDYGGDGAGTEFEKGQHEIDYSAKSTKWKLPSAYWHQAPPTGKGQVEIFGLDTNMILYNKADDQKKDFPDWIKASTADWKIAVGHHPYLSNGPHGNAGKYDGLSSSPGNGSRVKTFFDDTICGKVDLYISGHDHNRQWLSETCKGTQLAVSGAGAKSYELGGKNATLFESIGLGFLYIVIDGKTLTAEFLDEDGKTEFTHTIEKP